MSKLLLIDTDRNKVVGEFCSTKEALKYAKKGIKVIASKRLKG